MKTDNEFKEQFFFLAKFLGGNARILHEHLGKYDEIDEDEYRTYVWFKNTKASFYFGNNDIVGSISIPKADAYGNNHFEEPNYFILDGIKQGMSKSEVQNLWGQPDWKAEAVWGYKNRGGITNSGQEFELCVEFIETDNTFNVSHFEARIIENEEQTSQPIQATKSNGGCFIATACYGDYNAQEVLILRNFRDNVLLKSRIGNWAVSAYYFLSPPLAKILNRSESLKLFVRNKILNPFISKINKKKQITMD